MPTIRCVLGWGFTSFIVWGKFQDKQRTYDTKMYPILVCEWVNKWRENKLNVLMTIFLLSSATCIYILYVHTCIIHTCTDAGTIHTCICVCVCLRVCACVDVCMYVPAYTSLHTSVTHARAPQHLHGRVPCTWMESYPHHIRSHIDQISQYCTVLLSLCVL